MIFTHCTPSMFLKSLQPATIILNKIMPIFAHIKWAWTFILHQSFFLPSSHTPHLQQSIDSHSVRRTAHHPNTGDSDECAVCLCSIRAGDEIRELTCKHVFHSVCLDRWVIGYGRWTCPLCRNHLKLLPRMDAQFHQQVLVFNFCDFSSSDHDTWWLR